MVATMTTDEITAELQRRVAALYRLNTQLAAQADRMRAVVTVAEVLAHYGVSAAGYNDLQTAVDHYRDQMARLTKGVQVGDGRL